jgi:hypothetical protein
MWVAIAAITGWALITLYRMHLAGQARDRLHRERLAMIEKGLVPPPESDPGQFERMMDWHPSAAGSRGPRSLRTGLIIVATGIGLGLMNYLQASNASAARSGLGIAAFLVVLGIAFLVHAMFEARSTQPDTQSAQEKR